MRTFLRVLLILIAALVVVGATATLTQLEAVQTAIASERRGPPAGFETGQIPDFGSDGGEALTDGDNALAVASVTTRAFPGEVERRGGDEDGGNLAGLVEVAKNLAIVVVITLAVAVPSALAQRLRRQRRMALAAGRVAPM